VGSASTKRSDLDGVVTESSGMFWEQEVQNAHNASTGRWERVMGKRGLEEHMSCRFHDPKSRGL